MRDTVYHKPRGVTWKHTNDVLVTFAFTRHPFRRLVSAYNDKMNHGMWNPRQTPGRFSEHLTGIRDDIMIKYHNLDPKTSNDHPSPKTFVMYLVDQAKQYGPLSLNPHWRPQYALCPFCGLDFDYIGDIRDMNNHVKYLSELLGFKVMLKNCMHCLNNIIFRIYPH